MGDGAGEDENGKKCERNDEHVEKPVVAATHAVTDLGSEKRKL